MLIKEYIKNLLETLNQDIDSNITKIRKGFQNLDYLDEENQTLLHIFVDNVYDEDKCFLAIKSLLKAGLNPNAKADFNYNFIQTALYAGYSEKFIVKIIEESLKYNLNVNHVDDDGDTIMHTAIYSDDYLDEIINIYKTLMKTDFDFCKRDKEGRNLVEAMIFQNENLHQYTDEQITELKHLYQLADFKQSYLKDTNKEQKSPNSHNNEEETPEEEPKSRELEKLESLIEMIDEELKFLDLPRHPNKIFSKSTPKETISNDIEKLPLIKTISSELKVIETPKRKKHRRIQTPNYHQTISTLGKDGIKKDDLIVENHSPKVYTKN